MNIYYTAPSLIACVTCVFICDFSYDFPLSTILVVDEFGGGLPICYMLSTREDQILNHVFFSELRDALPIVISPRVFMSDDASAAYNAFCGVFGPPAMRLLCTWHVDRNWRTQIFQKMPGSSYELKANVYKTLRVLMQQETAEGFDSFLRDVLAAFSRNPETSAFGRYFETHYAGRSEQWAFCYRLHAGINTNMRLEAMHRVLKYVYCASKKVKRLDLCLNAIMKMTRDRLLKRLRDMLWNARPEVAKDVLERHERSHKIGRHLTRLNDSVTTFLKTLGVVLFCSCREHSAQLLNSHLPGIR
jgi:hypothetical protein